MADKDVQFYSDGLCLAATLSTPDREEFPPPWPAVVLCHGFGGIKELILPDLAAPLVAAGFAVLRFDYRGFGASEGARWRLVPLEQVQDVRDAITFLETETEIDSSRIGIYGTSFGGANAIVATALDSRIRSLVAQAAVADGSGWLRALRRHWEWLELLDRIRADSHSRVLTGVSQEVSSDDIMPSDPHSDAWHKEVLEQFPEREYRLPLETAQRILEYRPADHVAGLAGRPSLFIGVDGDALAPIDQFRALYESTPEPKQWHTIYGATHHGIYEGAALAESTGRAVNWFRETL